MVLYHIHTLQHGIATPLPGGFRLAAGYQFYDIYKFKSSERSVEDWTTPTVVEAEEDDAHLTQVTVTSRLQVGTLHLPRRETVH